MAPAATRDPDVAALALAGPSACVPATSSARTTCPARGDGAGLGRRGRAGGRARGRRRSRLRALPGRSRRCWGENDERPARRRHRRRAYQRGRRARSRRHRAARVGRRLHVRASTRRHGVVLGSQRSRTARRRQRGPGRPSATRPVAVRGLADVVQIAAGRGHACALRKAGQLVCWGDNREGQQGNDARKVWVAPVMVSGIAGVRRSRPAMRTPACRASRARCPVSAATIAASSVRPERAAASRGRIVPGTEGARSIAAGAAHTCIATRDGDGAAGALGASGQLDGTPGRSDPSPTGTRARARGRGRLPATSTAARASTTASSRAGDRTPRVGSATAPPMARTGLVASRG